MCPLTRWIKTHVPFFIRLTLAWLFWVLMATLVAAWLETGRI
jgi:hypothetical protein